MCEAQTRKLVSEEHRALGHRPPAVSLAAMAQAEAAKHSGGAFSRQPATHTLQRAALEDAANVEGSGVAANIDLNFIGQGEPFVPIPS